jgi:hypothetical protein
MDGETILTFSFANWITVLLMVAIGYFIGTTVYKLIQSKQTAGA